MGITLLRDTSFYHHLPRLLNNGVSACILNNLLPAIKPPNISQLSYESTSKFKGDAGNRRDNQDFKRKKTFNFFGEELRELFGIRNKEKELFYMELQRSLKTGVRNTYGILGSSDNIFSGERRLSSLLSAVGLQTLVHLISTGLSNKGSRREGRKDRKKGIGENIKHSLSFWKEDRKEISDFGFTLRDFLFNSLNFPCKESNRRNIGRGTDQLWLRRSKESDEESILLVGLGGVRRGVKIRKTTNYFWVNDADIKTCFAQEDKKRNVESSGRFHHNHRMRIGGKRIKHLTKGKEAFLRVRKRTFVDDATIFRINDTEVERVLRDVNSNVEHGKTSLLSFFDLSLISILPGCGGFLAQPTYRELRDRGTDSFRGFRAYVKWSPCPSLFLGNIN
jgi:hypothetical protein